MKTIHFIYFLPSDVTENTTYTNILRTAVLNIRRRFAALREDNRSFRIPPQLVEVWTSNQNSDYFSTATSSTSYYSRLWGNFQSVSGYQATETNDKFVIFGHPMFATYPTAGSGGLTQNPSNDYCAVNPNLFFPRLESDPNSAESYSIMGTVMHEMGHLLGFDHNTDGLTLMSTSGRVQYPDCYFTPSETTILKNSDYFNYSITPVIQNVSSLTNISGIIA